MKKILSFLAWVFVGYAPMQAQKVLLDEDFNTNKNGWPIYTDKPNFLIYNGKLIFAVNDSLTYNVVMPTLLEDKKDFSITATCTHTDGSTNHGFGVYFGASDLNNYYSFNISGNGYYRFSKSTTTEYVELIKWTASTAIKIGNYTDNVLQLSRQGTNWTIAVNGQVLATLPATVFFGNKVGFTQSTMQRVEYDNVKIIQN
jgi:hypothetical protein